MSDLELELLPPLVTILMGRVVLGFVEGAADDTRRGWVIRPDGLVVRGAPGRGQE